MNVWTVILCAGKSRRMGLGVNKTLLPLPDGAPAFLHCVRAFGPFSDGVVLVTGREERGQFEDCLKTEAFSFPIRFAEGGQERQDRIHYRQVQKPQALESRQSQALYCQHILQIGFCHR